MSKYVKLKKSMQEDGKDSVMNMLMEKTLVILHME